MGKLFSVIIFSKAICDSSEILNDPAYFSRKVYQ